MTIPWKNICILTKSQNLQFTPEGKKGQDEVSKDGWFNIWQL